MTEDPSHTEVIVPASSTAGVASAASSVAMTAMLS
jgi:hypothetical protein